MTEQGQFKSAGWNTTTECKVLLRCIYLVCQIKMRYLASWTQNHMCGILLSRCCFILCMLLRHTCTCNFLAPSHEVDSLIGLPFTVHRTTKSLSFMGIWYKMLMTHQRVLVGSYGTSMQRSNCISMHAHTHVVLPEARSTTPYIRQV